MQENGGGKKIQKSSIFTAHNQDNPTLNNIVDHHHGRLEIAFWQGARNLIKGLHRALQEHRARDKIIEEEGLLPSLTGIVQLRAITKVCC